MWYLYISGSSGGKRLLRAIFSIAYSWESSLVKLGNEGLSMHG